MDFTNCKCGKNINNQIVNKKINSDIFDAKMTDSYTKTVDSLKRSYATHFKASQRLHLYGEISLYTTVVISLILIFITIQNINPQPDPNSKSKKSAIATTYLAISVLVYSVVIGKGNYEVRSNRQHELGNKIKKLAREINMKKEMAVDKNKAFTMEQGLEYLNVYSQIISDSESPHQTDFWFADNDIKNKQKDKDKTTCCLPNWQMCKAYLIIIIYLFAMPLLLGIPALYYFCTAL